MHTRLPRAVAAGRGVALVLVAAFLPLLARGARAQAVLPGLPDTPPGRVVSAWIAAINSADRAMIQAFIDRSWPGTPAVDIWLARAKSTGGYNVGPVRQSTPTRLSVMLQQRTDTSLYNPVTVWLSRDVPERIDSLILLRAVTIASSSTVLTGAALAEARAGAPYKLFAAWLDAFNAADPARMQAFVASTWPSATVEGQRGLQDRSGGYELVALERGTPTTVVGTLRARNAARTVRFTLAIDAAAPSKVARLAVVPIPPPLPPGAVTVSSWPTGRGRGAVIDALRVRLADDVAGDDVGSATAALVVGDSVVWVEAFGWADRERRIKATPETIYRIGSITKTFTAVMLAQLVDRGLVSLDDRVDRLVPEARGFLNAPPLAPTLRQLSSHTGGLARDPASGGLGPVVGWDQRLLTIIPSTAFIARPGERYQYSNVGASLLGLALDRAARTPYPTYIERNVLAPLGMTHTTFGVPPALRRSLATGYILDATGHALAAQDSLDGFGYAVPVGSLFSTVGDMARLVAMLTGGGPARGIVSDSMRRAMMTRQTGPGMTDAYGLGLQVPIIRGVKVPGHGGVVSGYFAAIAFEPETRVGIVLLRNYDGTMPLAETATQVVRALAAERGGGPR